MWGYVCPNSASKPSENETKKTSPAQQKGPSKKETRGIAKADRKANDYLEQKIDVKPTVNYDPQQEFINSLLMVDVGDSIWHQKKSDCPNCDKDITLDEIKKICVDKRNNCLVEDETMIRAALPYLNIYRKKVGINTCIRKAHFLAQISQESKFYSLQENFNWYWEKLIGKFSSYFNQFRTRLEKETEAKRLGRINRLPTPGLTLNQQIELANAIYGHTHPLGRLHINTGDGWLYSGKGFKQITWKENYQNLERYFNTHMKDDNEPDVDWTDGDNPYKLKNNPKDAITSALAYWGKNNINSLANENNAKAVEKVSLKINAIADGLKERQRFFKKANDILKLSDCKAGTFSNLDIGTVVVVSGEGSKKIQDWVVYKTNIYFNMSLETYEKQKTENKLPVEDYSIFLSRDAHGDKTKYGKHSNMRYGKNNETPPGEYYLIPKSNGQKYKIYLSDDGKSASINGPHGIRAGIAIHQYSPKYSIGCLTTVTGQDTKLVEELLSKLEDLPLNDERPVRIIVEQRSVKEEKWDNTEIGDTKWTGIL
ncbi:glycoside hydrolase family 19 protein [Flavobacterium anhuiense]|uniref:glycoside hydrolase family 19 protein n=1 Tax=Flavobacterium anhuiense TaxID=459526 RepID=UPI003D9660E4